MKFAKGCFMHSQIRKSMRSKNIKWWKCVLMVFIGTSLLMLGACNKSQNSAVKLNTDEEKALYSMGIMFGGRLADLKLSDAELDYLVQGIRDSAKGKRPEVDVKQYQTKVRDLFTERLKKNSEINKKEGADYINKFVKEEGAIKTPSGLAYKVITPGTGKNPKPTDIVEVHYKGTLLNGTVFDSSYERNEKVQFPLNRVIRGWTEGLQLIKEGGKIKLAIPSDLAYGDHGAPPKIPGGATLIFEVELFKIMDDKKDNAPVLGNSNPTAPTSSAAATTSPAAKKK